MAIALILNGLVIGSLAAQHRETKPISLFGQVEGISREKKMVSVKHGKIAGYMDSGTTLYLVNKESVLERLRVGDGIRATVYANDLTLYHVIIVSRRAANPEEHIQVR